MIMYNEKFTYHFPCRHIRTTRRHPVSICTDVVAAILHRLFDIIVEELEYAGGKENETDEGQG
jgi:hypothetical protein